MVVIHTYTKFAAILRSLDEAEKCAAQIAEVKLGALMIAQAILFVKQHSVNCVAAAMYAMTRYDPGLFPPEDAEAFANLLFGEVPAAELAPNGRPLANERVRPSAAPRTKLPVADAAAVKAHIIDLYRQFLAAGENAPRWEEPLVQFMREMPQAV